VGTFGAYHFGQKVQNEKDAAADAEKKKQAEKSAMTGVLKPERKIILSAQYKVFPLLELGDSGSVFGFTGPKDQPFMSFARDTALTITKDEKGIKVSTRIKDKDGKIIAELIDNEWKLNPNNLWDRNYSQNALEVKDAEGDIVLQVRLLDDRVQLQAKFYNSSGRGIAIGKDESGHGAIVFSPKDNPKQTIKMEPIFRYPSDLHLGELVGSDVKAVPGKPAQPTTK
jgi:hypothetical protein